MIKTKKMNSKRYISRIIYWAYNFVCFILIAFIIFWLGTYFNGLLIPDSIKWNSEGEIRGNLILYNSLHFSLMLVELIISTYLLYRINKYYMIRVIKGDKSLALQPSLFIFLVLVLCICFVFM